MHYLLDIQDSQCTYNVTLWSVRVTKAAVEAQQCILCVCCWAHVTVRYIKILTVAQQCLYVKLISPTIMNRAFCPVLHRNTIMFVCSFSFCRRARGTVDQLCLSAAVKLCTRTEGINPLNAELNPIRHLLALVGARHIVHVSRVRVN